MFPDKEKYNKEIKTKERIKRLERMIEISQDNIISYLEEITRLEKELSDNNE